ncbi:hypothetical protein CEXT_687321 [Caerostris extrusa]|uniref:Uncharacterized protein n=1 Tax=Caerostris extrusa TaxID=172846 RepID=A0AAV4V6X1_CAEEX|nr:hypothetical protein CEXT_687321 [Caerostris extrusa]
MESPVIFQKVQLNSFQKSKCEMSRNAPLARSLSENDESVNTSDSDSSSSIKSFRREKVEVVIRGGRRDSGEAPRVERERKNPGERREQVPGSVPFNVPLVQRPRYRRVVIPKPEVFPEPDPPTWKDRLLDVASNTVRRVVEFFSQIDSCNQQCRC